MADAYAHISQESELGTARIVEREICGDLVPSCSSFGSGDNISAPD
jgi:hypothetical protein